MKLKGESYMSTFLKKHSNKLGYTVIFGFLLSVLFTPFIGILLGAAIGFAVGYNEDRKKQ